MRKANLFFANGFTLIELLIVIALVAVLAIGGIVAFSSYSRAQTLSAASKEVIVMLNLAKSRAYSQVKPSTAICDTESLAGYELRICSSSCPGTPAGTNPDFGLYVRCGSQSTSISFTELPNVTITSNTNPYFFPVLKGGVEKEGIVTIQNSFSETKQVEVDGSGLINPK